MSDKKCERSLWSLVSWETPEDIIEMTGVVNINDYRDGYGSSVLHELVATNPDNVRYYDRILNTCLESPNCPLNDSLTHAVMCNKCPADIIVRLINAGAQVDSSSGREDKSVLMLACSADIAKILVAAGAQIDKQDSRGRTPLYHADDIDMVEFLLHKGANRMNRDDNGCTALMYHLSNADSNVMNPIRLINSASGEELDVRDEKGHDVTHYAKMHNDKFLTDWLMGEIVDRRAVLASTAPKASTALKRKVLLKILKKDDLEALQSTLKCKNVNAVSPGRAGCDGTTILNLAAQHNAVNIVRGCLRFGGTLPETPDNRGITPIESTTSIPIMKMLCMYMGEDVRNCEATARAFIGHARAGNEEVAEYLFRLIAREDHSSVRDSDGVSVLIATACFQDEEMIRDYWEGKDVDELSARDAQLLLYIAAGSGNEYAMHKALKFGARMHTASAIDKKTPYERANPDTIEMMKLLSAQYMTERAKNLE